MREKVAFAFILFTLIGGPAYGRPVEPRRIETFITTDFDCSRFRGSKLIVLDEAGDARKLRFEGYGICEGSRVSLEAAFAQARARRGFVTVQVTLNTKGRISHLIGLRVETSLRTN